VPDFAAAPLDELVRLLANPRPFVRLHAQGEILTRGRSTSATQALRALANDSKALLEGRAAGIYTLKQLDGSQSHPALVGLVGDASVREFALRALSDRLSELDGLDAAPFVEALNDPSPRVRAQAVVSLGRLRSQAAARSLIPLTSRPAESIPPTARPLQNQPDPDRVIPHLAVRALVSLHAVDACLEALDGPHWKGALWALRSMHDARAVDGLIKRLSTSRSSELRCAMLATLIRLYHREAPYDGSWWGIRPDSTGPYYDRIEWEASPRIAAVVTAAVADADGLVAEFLLSELARHRVALARATGDSRTAAREEEKPIVLPKADPNDPNQIANMDYAAALKETLASRGDAQRGEALFKAQSCAACHTTADGQTPRGPHLVDIGKRYKAEELAESILKPSEKLAQGYETYAFSTTEGRVYSGFVVSERAQATLIRDLTGVERELLKSEIEERVQRKESAMPEGLVVNLTPWQLADLIAYLQSLK
jgi:putative heme-binding domain-containing protein